MLTVPSVDSLLAEASPLGAAVSGEMLGSVADRTALAAAMASSAVATLSRFEAGPSTDSPVSALSDVSAAALCRNLAWAVKLHKTLMNIPDPKAIVIESLRGYAEGHLVKSLTTAQQSFAAVRDEALLDSCCEDCTRVLELIGTGLKAGRTADKQQSQQVDCL
ncbi:MAG: hypothetical protein FRX49_10344 [Trebouxia sp. A1-2]|nr:MAG: hypothetical protein FRX49_10344 [Trebouxia sp. A1-2]